MSKCSGVTKQMPYDPRLLSKVTFLYYQHDLTQQEIAQRLGLTRQTVGRLLRQARQEGIVEIRIVSPLGHVSDLEDQLEAKYGLEEAVVVADDVIVDEAALKQLLGEAGAKVLSRRLKPGYTLGFSWGSTVHQVFAYLEPQSLRNIQVVQLNGDTIRPGVISWASSILATAARLGAITFSLQVPMVVDTPAIREALLSDTHINATVSLGASADIYIFGVGIPTPDATAVHAGYLREEDINELVRHGAVGDIGGVFFDREGLPVQIPYNQRVVTVMHEFLRSSQKPRIAVAGGAEKTKALAAVLKGGYCNILVTNESCARTLVENNL